MEPSYFSFQSFSLRFCLLTSLEAYMMLYSSHHKLKDTKARHLVKDLREFIQHLLCANYWVNSHEMWGVVFLIPVLQIRKQIQRVEVTCPSYSWSRKRVDIQKVSDFKFVFLPLRSMDKLIFEIVFLTDFWF